MNAEECAQRLRAAMTGLSPSMTIDARATPEGELHLVLTIRDAQGRVEDIREQTVRGVVTAASAAGPERFDAYLAATARWLSARGGSSPVFAHELFVLSMLGDARLVSVADFAAVIADPTRRELYVAADELRAVFARHGLVSPSDDALRALFALTPEGRSAKGIEEAVRAVRWLATDEWGRAASVAMMTEWSNEEWDPYDVAWDNGPNTANLLISGTWRLLDPVLPDGELRRRALACVNRLSRPVDAATLARAGF